jgi:hypothetical protein
MLLLSVVGICDAHARVFDPSIHPFQLILLVAQVCFHSLLTTGLVLVLLLMNLWKFGLELRIDNHG